MPPLLAIITYLDRVGISVLGTFLWTRVDPTREIFRSGDIPTEPVTAGIITPPAPRAA